MSEQLFDEFDPKSVACKLEANAEGNLLYTNFVPPTVQVVPNAAIMVLAVFQRLTTEPEFNDEMMAWAQQHLGARQAGGN